MKGQTWLIVGAILLFFVVGITIGSFAGKRSMIKSKDAEFAIVKSNMKDSIIKEQQKTAALSEELKKCTKDKNKYAEIINQSPVITESKEYNKLKDAHEKLKSDLAYAQMKHIKALNLLDSITKTKPITHEDVSIDALLDDIRILINEG